MDSQAVNTIFSMLNRETGREREAPRGKVEGYKMRIDTCSDPTPPPAWLVLCRGLNPQLQELWHSQGWDLEVQLAASALSRAPGVLSPAGHGTTVFPSVGTGSSTPGCCGTPRDSHNELVAV